MRHVGVDLHSNNIVVCFRKNDTEKTFATYSLFGKDFQRFKQSLQAEDEIAVESTSNTGYFVRQIRDNVKKIRITNPVQFKIISNSVKKTDENDAATLALFSSKGLIPEVRLKSSQDAQMSSLIGTRDKLVKLRTILKNKIQGILTAYGIQSKKEAFSSEKNLENLFQLHLEESAQFEIKILVDQIKALNASIFQIDQRLKSKAQHLKGFKNIISIKGIGCTTAVILLNTIGNINDFENPKKLAAYLGIVPRVSISNHSIHSGHITKMGNSIARTALVQATWVAIRYNDHLKAFYSRLKEKKGAGKAIIATARKLLYIIFNTLKNNWIFKDFNNFILE